MTITSIGYDGSVTEADWAKLLPAGGASRFGVAGPYDFKPTAVAGADRTIQLAAAPNGAWGDGVMDTSDQPLTLQHDIVASGSRWDLVVLRRDWQGAGGQTSAAIILGGAEKVIPAGRLNSPGITSDQPIALVQLTAGSTAPTAIVDLRTWAANGGMVAADDLARSYLDAVGTRMVINGADWLRTRDANGDPVWREQSRKARAMNAGDWEGGAIPIYTSPDGNLITLTRITIPDPGYPYIVMAYATLEGGAGGLPGTRWDVRIESNVQGRLGIDRGDQSAPWFKVTGFGWAPITGGSFVDLNLFRVYGSSSFGLTTYNREFRVLVIPA